MKPDSLGELPAWLAATDIGYLELRGPDGSVLRLLNQSGQVTSAPADFEPSPVATSVVRAPAAGRTLLAHPLRSGPLVQSGDRVAQGQPLLLLSVGSLLMCVPSPQSGVVMAVHQSDEQLVGYGTPLVTLQPLPASDATSQP